MKKLIYIIAMLSIPAMAFSQEQTVTQNTSYSTDYKTHNRVLEISPNPGNGQFNVLFAKNHDIYTSMFVCDNSGRMVYQKEHLNGNAIQIDLSHLQPGIYFAVFMANNRMERITERIAIVK
jgi:hypothetical protein